MRTLAQPTCPICRSGGTELYRDLQDHLFGAPGAWSMKRCTSPDCGALWLDPAPVAEDLPRAYRGYYTHAPGQMPDAGLRKAVRLGFAAHALGYAPPAGWRGRLFGPLVALSPKRRESTLYKWFYLRAQPGGQVLEVGCGAGEQLETLRDSGWSVTGVDFDPDAVRVARARGLEVLEGDLRDLGLPDRSFDAVVMAHVIEHVPQPVSLLAECGRLLRPGGKLVCITPNAESLGHRMWGRDWRGLEPPRHLAVFTPRALDLAAVRAGLEVRSLRVTARDAANLLLASERIARAQPGETIRKPEADRTPPLRLRALELAEEVASWLGRRWGEELVLSAVKPSTLYAPGIRA